MDDHAGCSAGSVRVWEERVAIPTYGVGEPDKNPMFLEKRVYQGSSGKVYPYPVIDRIDDEKRDKTYQIVFLENEYLHIEIIPELGGRVYRAIDLTNGYDFVYYNRVIKPALVGLAGPWISGGIEFNWPQHHRPNTFGPVEYRILHNDDGSKTVWVSEVDRMHGTKGAAGFTLHPAKAYLEIRGQLYNRTNQPQTFLWWANPAVAVHDQTQSIFPPDVHAVFDHGRRDVSRFPIATGTYYKADYSAGVDISRYRNIPVPTSYMVHHSDYDFVGAFDYRERAGILHIADHHVAPGKKQWTWGSGDFGKAWDRNLTDADGPYIELMTGVYTDNQPDFTWLQPNEEKTFVQYFMPYQAIGAVKNATVDAALNLDVERDVENGDWVVVQAYATSVFNEARIEVTCEQDRLFSQTCQLAPGKPLCEPFRLPTGVAADELKLTLYTHDGRVLVSYQAAKASVSPLPEAAKAIAAPEDLKNAEALYLAGLHLEQYRHATRRTEDYYREGLRRDPDDIRLNNAYGSVLYRRGLFAESERHHRRAVTSATRHNPNPLDGEGYFQLGRALKAQGQLEEAFSAFSKSTWDAAYQDSGCLAMAQISTQMQQWHQAFDLVEKSLVRNARSPLAQNLKSALLIRINQLYEAQTCLRDTIVIDPTDFSAHHQLARLYATMGQTQESVQMWRAYDRLVGSAVHNLLSLVADYAESGLMDEAQEALTHRLLLGGDQPPMLWYSLAMIHARSGDHDKVAEDLYQAGAAQPDYCFPNTLWDLMVLQHALEVAPGDGMAHYYLGNWLYDKGRPDDAIWHWQESAQLRPDFPTVHRNLGLAWANKHDNLEQALVHFETAFARNPSDARVFYELDQLQKKMGRSPAQRYRRLYQHRYLVDQRDELYIEFVTLHNFLDHCDEALDLLHKRNFHPWEGGEGKAAGQFVYALLEIGKQHLEAQHDQQAVETFRQALTYPTNLGEGKLYGAQENHIYYYLAVALAATGHRDEANQAFRTASIGLAEPKDAMFYNDQPPDTIFYQGLALQHLGRLEEARGRFHKLIDYGEQHLFDEVTIDYFAVSLPNFLIFEDDLNRRNQAHCHYMIGLGEFGLGQLERAERSFEEVLRLDVCHLGAKTALRMVVGAVGGTTRAR